MGKTDRLTPQEKMQLDEQAYVTSLASSMVSQIGFSSNLTKRTRQELHETAVELVGISARLSRIAIVSLPAKEPDVHQNHPDTL